MKIQDIENSPDFTPAAKSNALFTLGFVANRLLYFAESVDKSKGEDAAICILYRSLANKDRTISVECYDDGDVCILLNYGREILSTDVVSRKELEENLIRIFSNLR